METFYFFIPLAVVAAMGLVHDGMTVSREVRVSDLLTDGTLTVSEYHALASAGVVFMPVPVFTFQTVEEATEGWVCAHLEPEPLAWEHSLAHLRELFPGGKCHVRDWQLWLPEPPPRGRYFHRVEVYTEDVKKVKPFSFFRYARIHRYMFAEGIVSVPEGEPVWVHMYLYRLINTEYPSYFCEVKGRYKNFQYDDYEH